MSTGPPKNTIWDPAVCADLKKKFIVRGGAWEPKRVATRRAAAKQSRFYRDMTSLPSEQTVGVQAPRALEADLHGGLADRPAGLPMWMYDGPRGEAQVERHFSPGIDGKSKRWADWHTEGSALGNLRHLYNMQGLLRTRQPLEAQHLLAAGRLLCRGLEEHCGLRVHVALPQPFLFGQPGNMGCMDDVMDVIDNLCLFRAHVAVFFVNVRPAEDAWQHWVAVLVNQRSGTTFYHDPAWQENAEEAFIAVMDGLRAQYVGCNAGADCAGMVFSNAHIVGSQTPAGRRADNELLHCGLLALEWVHGCLREGVVDQEDHEGVTRSARDEGPPGGLSDVARRWIRRVSMEFVRELTLPLYPEEITAFHVDAMASADAAIVPAAEAKYRRRRQPAWRRSLAADLRRAMAKLQRGTSPVEEENMIPPHRSPSPAADIVTPTRLHPRYSLRPTPTKRNPPAG